MIKENEVHWFALRVRNSTPNRLEALKTLLDREEKVKETYIPLAFLKVSQTKMDFAPSLVNFIYVRASLADMRAIKGNKERYEALRYVMHPVYDEHYNISTEPIYVSDKRMDDFKLTTAVANDRVIFLDNPNYACKPSQEVQITEGEFAGVKGRIKRIQGNRCVVIPIGKDVAVAITGLSRKQLRYLSEAEIYEDENE